MTPTILLVIHALEKEQIPIQHVLPAGGGDVLAAEVHEEAGEVPILRAWAMCTGFFLLVQA